MERIDKQSGTSAVKKPGIDRNTLRTAFEEREETSEMENKKQNLLNRSTSIKRRE